MPYEGLDPFITGADLSDYLGRDVTEDDAAAAAVAGACTLIRNSIDQRLDVVSDDVIFVDGSGTDTLLLPELPIVSVSAVTYRGTALSDETDFILNKRRGSLVARRARATWLKGRANYAVTYTHGYTAMPDDLRTLATHVAARFYDQGIVKLENVGGYRVMYAVDDAAGLTPRELSIVAKYRAVRAAESYDS